MEKSFPTMQGLELRASAQTRLARVSGLSCRTSRDDGISNGHAMVFALLVLPGESLEGQRRCWDWGCRTGPLSRPRLLQSRPQIPADALHIRTHRRCGHTQLGPIESEVVGRQHASSPTSKLIGTSCGAPPVSAGLACRSVRCSLA